jgi:hypothetical protein
VSIVCIPILVLDVLKTVPCSLVCQVIFFFGGGACCFASEELYFDLGETLLFSPSPLSDSIENVQARTIK